MHASTQNFSILRLTRDAIKGKDVVHERRGEDNLIINWHAASNQPSVSSLRVHRQVTAIAVPTRGETSTLTNFLISHLCISPFHSQFLRYLRIWETSSVVWGLSNTSLEPANDVRAADVSISELMWENTSSRATLVSSAHHLLLIWANPHYSTPAGRDQWGLCLVGSSWRSSNLLELSWRKAACLGLQQARVLARLPQCAAFDRRVQTAMRWPEVIYCRGSQVSVWLRLEMRRCSDVWELPSVLVFFGKSPPSLER